MPSTASGRGSREQALGEEARGFRDRHAARRLRLALSASRAALSGPARGPLGVHVERDDSPRLRHRPLQGPPLETALATTRIRMRNRIKGEYQDVCYVTGYVNDAEFGVTRDPFGEPCDEVGPKLARYKLGERFSSRWIAQ